MGSVGQRFEEGHLNCLIRLVVLYVEQYDILSIFNLVDVGLRT